MMIGFFVGRMYMRWYRINVSCCHVKGVSWGGGDYCEWLRIAGGFLGFLVQGRVLGGGIKGRHTGLPLHYNTFFIGQVSPC